MQWVAVYVPRTIYLDPVHIPVSKGANVMIPK
jgi:hypothetical protein